MSDNNKDYFTEMVKLMLGMGIVAVVVVFAIRMLMGAFSSDAVNTDEAIRQGRLIELLPEYAIHFWELADLE